MNLIKLGGVRGWALHVALIRPYWRSTRADYSVILVWEEICHKTYVRDIEEAVALWYKNLCEDYYLEVMSDEQNRPMRAEAAHNYGRGPRFCTGNSGTKRDCHERCISECGCEV